MTPRTPNLGAISTHKDTAPIQEFETRKSDAHVRLIRKHSQHRYPLLVPVLSTSASYAGLNEWEEAAEDAAQCIKVNKKFVKGKPTRQMVVRFLFVSSGGERGVQGMVDLVGTSVRDTGEATYYVMA